MSSYSTAVRTVLVSVVTAALAVVMATSTQAALLTSPAQTWGVNGRTSVVLPLPSGRVVVGGSFTAVVDSGGATQFAVTNLALFDPGTGRFDPGWRPSVNGSVNALATDGTRLFLGGAFTKVGGANRDKVAAVSVDTGALETRWAGPSLDGPVDVMRLSAGALFVGGNWNTVTAGGTAYAQAKVAKLSASTGAFDTAFRPTANPTPGDVPPSGRVWALLVLGNGNLVLGGDFGDINGVTSTRRIAVVDPVTGTPVRGFASTANNGTSTATILDLATDGTLIYEAVAGSGGACTAVDATTGARRWTWHSNGNMQSVRVVGSTVYCGGHFGGAASFGTETRSKIAAVDARTGAILPWAPVVNSALGVWSMGSDAAHLYLGGDFTKVSGVAQQHFAMWVDTASMSVPGAPVLAATAGAGVVRLSWQPPSTDGGSTILRYKIWRKLAGAATYPSAALATVSEGTAYDDTTVADGTTYAYKVLAVNSLGSGPDSNEVTVTAGVAAQSAPSAPVSLTATLDSTSVTLAWTAPTSPGSPAFTRYDIYRGTVSGQRTLLTSVQAGTTTFSEALPPSGTTWFYAVRAVNTVGSSGDSNEVSTAGAAAGAPGQPSVAATATATAVDLTWTADGSGVAADKWVILRDNVQLARLTDPTARSYRDTTVVRGTTYTYKVRAVNAVGSSPNSDPVTVTVP